MAFSGNLFSREFFDLASSRLTPGGIFSTYVPTERTLRTLVQAFPYVIDFHAPDFASFAIASNEPLRFDPAQVLVALHSGEVRNYLDASGERRGVEQLVRRYLRQVRVEHIRGDAREPFFEGDVNTDLFPRDEFNHHYSGDYQ